MKKLTIIAATILMTGTAAIAQNTRTNTSTDSSRQPTEQDTVQNRARWDNPTTSDPNSMKTRPGVEIQMDNGTRQDQREFKNTVDTPGAPKKLPRRDR